MLTGMVNASREAVIRLKVRGSNGQEHEYDPLRATIRVTQTMPRALCDASGSVMLCYTVGGGTRQWTKRF
jgi:hypothetical protein